MKKLMFFLTLTLLLGACKENKQGDVSGAAPGVSTNYGEFNLTKVAGTNLQRAEKLDINGKVAEEGLLKDGMRNGVWVKYHEGSVFPAVLASYVDNKYNGLYLEFDINQQVTLRANYSENLLDGYWARYSYGTITFEATYNKGKLDGVYKEYRSSNNVAKEIHYKDGLLDGPYRFYDDQGSIVLEYIYRKGKKM